VYSKLLISEPNPFVNGTKTPLLGGYSMHTNKRGKRWEFSKRGGNYSALILDRIYRMDRIK
jgi:hypothetical protein